MRFKRAEFDRQNIHDCFVGFAFDDQIENFALPHRKSLKRKGLLLRFFADFGNQTGRFLLFNPNPNNRNNQNDQFNRHRNPRITGPKPLGIFFLEPNADRTKQQENSEYFEFFLLCRKQIGQNGPTLSSQPD